MDASRSLSGKIGESVDGIHEIKANAAFNIEGRNIGDRIERFKKIRITWNLYRFAVKVVNNLFTNFSRFLIFSLGGAYQTAAVTYKRTMDYYRLVHKTS